MGRPNGIMLSKRSQREKRQIWYDLLYVESLGGKKPNRSTENRLVVARGRGWGVGDIGEGTNF